MWRDTVQTNSQRLKPNPFRSMCGTAEAVPYKPHSLAVGWSRARSRLRHFAGCRFALVQELEEFDAFTRPALHHFRVAQHSAE